MVGSNDGADGVGGDPLAEIAPPEELFGLPREQLLGREVELDLVRGLLPRLILRVRGADRWRECDVPEPFLTEVSRSEVKVDRGALTRWLSAGRTPFDVTWLEFNVVDGRGRWSLGSSSMPLRLGPIADPIADGTPPQEAFGVNAAEYSTGELAIRAAREGRYYLDLHTADGEVHSIPVPDQFVEWTDAERLTDRYRLDRPALLRWLSVDTSAEPTGQLWELSKFIEEGRHMYLGDGALEFLGSVTDAPVAAPLWPADEAPERGETLLDVSSNPGLDGPPVIPPPPSASDEEAPAAAVPGPPAPRERRPGDDELLWDGMDPPTAFGIPVLDLRGAVVQYVGAVRGIGRHALEITLLDGTQHEVPVPGQFITSTGDDAGSLDATGLMEWLQIPLYPGMRPDPEAYMGAMPLGQIDPFAYEHPDDNIELNEATMASAIDRGDRVAFEQQRAASAFFSGRMLFVAIIVAAVVVVVPAVLFLGGGSDSDGVPVASGVEPTVADPAAGGAAAGGGSAGSVATSEPAGDATAEASSEAGGAPAASFGVASDGGGCAGVGTTEYTTVPASGQTVPGTVSLSDQFRFAAVDGGLSFCLETPEGVDIEGAIAGGGYLQSTLTLTLNNQNVEFTVSEGDGVAPFGRIVQRAGAVEQGRFPLDAEIVDRAVLIFVPAARTGGGLTFDLDGASYGELSFLGIGVGTFQNEVTTIWVGTAAGDVAAFDEAVSWG